MTGDLNQPLITMIDYGGSNLRSVQKAFEAVGARLIVTADPDEILQAKRLVLPGVGAFAAGMNALRARGLEEAIVEVVSRGVPLLGICLGMQLLFDESEEMGRHHGLGLVPGRVVIFDGQHPSADGRRLKVPHVGWNQIIHDEQHPLLVGVPSGSHAYFVHSYFCAPENGSVVLATTDYGGSFAAIIGQRRLFGIQFHPEKSQSVGLRILRNFGALEVDEHGV